METFIEKFHFLRPLWLLALPVLWAVVAWAWRQQASSGAWKSMIDPALLPSLQLEKGQDGQKMVLWALITLLWTMASIALAGPSWQQVASNAYRAPSALVLVLDLSSSMASRDVQPNRATRARYAMSDLLDGAGDNKVGLVVFSDEAYAVVPLTDDVANVRAMLESLTPTIMPSQGDNLTPALARASELLKASPSQHKQIILLSDGFKDQASATNRVKTLAGQGIDLKVLGIQSAKDDHTALQQIAKAGAGHYYGLTQLPHLLSALKQQALGNAGGTLEKNVKLEKWLDNGVFFLPLLVLLAAFLGRRGWL